MTDDIELPDRWAVTDGKLRRVFEFANFVEAFAFMAQVAIIAECLDHHPEWSNVFGTVVIDLVSHDAGDTVTSRDVRMAKQINDLDHA